MPRLVAIYHVQKVRLYRQRLKYADIVGCSNAFYTGMLRTARRGYQARGLWEPRRSPSDHDGQRKLHNEVQQLQEHVSQHRVVVETRSEDQDARGQLEQTAVVWAASVQPAPPLYTQGGRECERGLCRKPRQLTNPGVGTASETDVHGLIDANLQSPLVYARVPPRMHNQ